VSEQVSDQVAALRNGAGAFIYPRDIVKVSGPDAEAYLQGQLSQDVLALPVGESADSLLLHPDGKLCVLLRVTRTDAQSFVLDTDAGFGDTMIARLKKFLLRSKVEIERLEWRCLGLRGQDVSGAAAGLLTVLSEAGALVIPFSWNGWTGVDVLGPKDLVLDPYADKGPSPEGITPCDPDAVEECRVTAGIPAMGSELNDKTIAAEAGLVERTVSFTKGCYTGQELIARLDSRGNNVPRRLVSVIAGGDPSSQSLGVAMTLHAPDPPEVTGVPDALESAEVVVDKVVGTVTSAVWSTELQAWVGLAYLHRSVEAPGPIRIRSGDGLGDSRDARVELIPLVTVSGPG
jgi:tRNA-modifying protein YgfZ